MFEGLHNRVAYGLPEDKIIKVVYEGQGWVPNNKITDKTNMSKLCTPNIDVDDNGKIRRIDKDEIKEFAELYELNRLIPDRYSAVLIVDLMLNLKLNGIDPRYIIDEIKRLETINGEGFTKEATQFTRKPLYPLWHQHYFSAHYLVPNIQNEIIRSSNPECEKSILQDSSKDIDCFLNNLIEGAIETRSKEKRITGEWLVFSKQPTGNIYLCMATHETGDQNIYDKLAYCCKCQFPSLEPFASNRKKS